MTRSVLSTPDEIAELVADVAGAEARNGRAAAASECMRTVGVTTGFAGWTYRISRELSIGEIDCSTLVSQSLWAGAAVAAPFIAESQRNAYSASVVDGSQERWLPADVLVRFPSVPESPDRRHNHVALYVGRDGGGTQWILESRKPGGVRALPLYEDAAFGGVRRFLPNPTRVFRDDDPVLRLAAATPKVGRIGARLGETATHPHAHRGVDVYFSVPVEVLAPFAGRAELSRPGLVVLRGERGDETVVLSSITAAGGRRAWDVKAGEAVGRCLGGPRAGCNAVPALAPAYGLHIEYWTTRDLGYSDERSITTLAQPESEAGSPPVRAYNPLYAMKLGALGLPVTAEDALRAVAFPVA